MDRCVRAGCHGQALATWWRLCTGCTLPLLDRTDHTPEAAADQRATAGWDAVDWAERIAPHRWGHAVETDSWVMTVRCLVFAAVTTGRSHGCSHTTSPSPAPVVALPPAVDVLACPPCAEPVVARHTVDGVCDRCRRVPVTAADRVGAVAGSSLIIIAQLCSHCSAAVLELSPSLAATTDEGS